MDVAAFEQVALLAFEEAQQGRAVIVIDELAQMELASTAFVAALDELFELPVPLLATVHQRSHPVTDWIKGRPDVEVIEVMETNRDELPKESTNRMRVRMGLYWGGPPAIQSHPRREGSSRGVWH